MLPRSFYDREPLAVARDLLGCVVTASGVSVRLTEVEAYAGTADPASHAFRGPTPRSAVMFGPPGHLYVYFVYGMHWCANLVCGPDGTASAVLLRAGEVVEGEALARQRRPAARSNRDLARGPAKLAGVLALSGADTGADLCHCGAAIRICSGGPVPDALVHRGPRVGVAAGGEWPWRFWLAGDPTVSGYRAAVRRTRRAPAGVPDRADPGAGVPDAPAPGPVPGPGIAPNAAPRPGIAPGPVPGPGIAPNAASRPGIAPGPVPGPGIAPNAASRPGIVPGPGPVPGPAPGPAPAPAPAPDTGAHTSWRTGGAVRQTRGRE